MPEKLPIADAKEFADRRNLRQVIVIAWDGERTHCVTYGKTAEDCDQAALGAERLKQALKWPEWQSEPSRVKRLISALNKLIDTVRIHAQTGRDEELHEACNEAEKVLNARGRSRKP